jgi:hypothetical protein
MKLRQAFRRRTSRRFRKRLALPGGMKFVPRVTISLVGKDYETGGPTVVLYDAPIGEVVDFFALTGFEVVLYGIDESGTVVRCRLEKRLSVMPVLAESES